MESKLVILSIGSADYSSSGAVKHLCGLYENGGPMQGKHHYQPELFSQIDYQNLIPKSHLLRKTDQVLDLTFLRVLTSSFYSSEQGRPSIDPEIFVRMILLEFLYNIDSDRQLCEEVGYNLAYRWFCELSLTDRVPDHSSITRIRDRLGEETYRKIFLKIVDQCKAAGLVKGEARWQTALCLGPMLRFIK